MDKGQKKWHHNPAVTYKAFDEGRICSQGLKIPFTRNCQPTRKA